MAKPVDLATLDPGTRRLAERGAREAFGASLDDLIDDFHITGEDFDETDLETLVLAGRVAERAGFPEPVMPPDSSLTPVPVDIASLNLDILRLAGRGARELFGMPLDRLVDNLKIAGEEFDQKDLDTLMLAGRMAEEIDRKDVRSSE
jgi:hypothetical protein